MYIRFALVSRTALDDQDAGSNCGCATIRAHPDAPLGIRHGLSIVECAAMYRRLVVADVVAEVAIGERKNLRATRAAPARDVVDWRGALQIPYRRRYLVERTWIYLVRL